MAAAPVHTLIVTNIHHIHQHQCLPNEDALSQRVSLIIDKNCSKILGVCVCVCVCVRVCVCGRVCVCVCVFV